MFDLWEKELTDEEADQLIEKAVTEITKRKLQFPAMLFFEMHRPLSFVGSQAAIVFSPFLVPFIGFDSVNDFSRLFSRRDSVDRLVARLEQEAKPRKKEAG